MTTLLEMLPTKVLEIIIILNIVLAAFVGCIYFYRKWHKSKFLSWCLIVALHMLLLIGAIFMSKFAVIIYTILIPLAIRKRLKAKQESYS